jgi:hypothetical protein
MDLMNRIRQRTSQIDRYRPDRLAPTASIRMDFLSGAWSGGGAPERLVRLCRGCLGALDADPLPAGRFQGRLRLPRPGRACLWVGLDAGRQWLEVNPSEASSDFLIERFRASAATHQASKERGAGRCPTGCLEILDLSGTGVSDWRGVVTRGLVARLVMLSQDHLFQPETGEWLAAWPVVLDFDHRLLDAGRASRFLKAIQSGLDEERAD